MWLIFVSHVYLKRMYILKLLNVLYHKYSVDWVGYVVQIFLSLPILLLLSFCISVTEQVC